MDKIWKWWKGAWAAEENSRYKKREVTNPSSSNKTQKKEINSAYQSIISRYCFLPKMNSPKQTCGSALINGTMVLSNKLDCYAAVLSSWTMVLSNKLLDKSALINGLLAWVLFPFFNAIGVPIDEMQLEQMTGREPLVLRWLSQQAALNAEHPSLLNHQVTPPWPLGTCRDQQIF